MRRRWTLLLLALLLTLPVFSDPNQDMIVEIRSKSAEEQALPRYQSWLEHFVRMGAMPYLHSLDSLACQSLFSMGDEARFLAAIGSRDGTDHNRIYIRGHRPPRHLDGGPYVFPIDVGTAYYPFGPEKSTFWHEVCHSLLDTAGASCDPAPYVAYLETDGNTDTHHVYIEAIGERCVDAYRLLLRLEQAMREAQAEVQRAKGPLDPARERAVWGQTRTAWGMFLNAWVRVAPVPQHVRDELRQATGVFFSPPEAVQQFYAGGGLDGIVPPAWVWSDVYELESVFLMVKGSGGEEDRDTWVAERTVTTRGLRGNEVRQGILTIRLESDDRLVGIRVLDQNRQPVPGVAGPTGASSRLYQVDLAQTKQDLLIRFTHGRLSEHTDPTPYVVSVEYADTAPDKRYNTARTEISFEVPVARPRPPTPTPSPSPTTAPTSAPTPVTKTTLRGPAEAIISEEFTVEALLPANVSAARYEWLKSDRVVGTTTEPRLKYQYGWNEGSGFRVRLLDKAGKYIAESDPISVVPLQPHFSLDLYGAGWTGQEDANGGLSYRRPESLTISEQLAEGGSTARASGSAGSAYFQIRWMDSREVSSAPADGPRVVAGFKGDGKRFVKGKVGFVVEMEAQAYLSTTAGVGPRGQELAGRLRSKHLGTIEGARKATQADLDAMLASLRITARHETSKRPGHDAGSPVAKATVKLSADRTRLAAGEVATLTVKVENATGPFTYRWTGPVQGKGERVTVTGAQPGKVAVSVEVSDPSGPVGSDRLELEVAALKVEISCSTTSATVGAALKLQARLTPPAAKAVVRWEPSTEVGFTPTEGTSVEARMQKPGKVAIWAVALDKDTGATLGQSDPLEIQVTEVPLRIAFTPASAYVGQEIRARVEGSDVPTEARFLWQLPNELRQTARSADGRELTLLVTSDKPLELKATAAAPVSGEVLGEASAGFQASLVPVQVQLVKPPKEVGLHQDVTLKATLTPAPARPVNYRWKVNEDSHIVGVDNAQEVSVNRSQAGPCAAQVEVVDARDGFVVGRGSGGFAASGPSRSDTRVRDLVSQGRHEEAAALVSPGSSLGLWVAAECKKLGWELLGKPEFERSVKLLEWASKLAPADADAARKAKQAQQARANYARMLAWWPTFQALIAGKKVVQAHQALLQLDGMKAGMRAEPKLVADATKLFGELTVETQNWVSDHQERWTQCFQQLDWKAAVATLEEALGRELWPASEKDFRASLGMARKNLAEQNAAYAVYEKVLAAWSAGKATAADGEKLRPDLFGPQDSRRAAIQDLRNKLLAGGGSQRGFQLLGQGKAVEAEAAFTASLAAAPDARSFEGRGDARRIQGNLPGAIADYDQALVLNPTAEVYVKRGNTKNRYLDHVGAEIDFNSALGMKPSLVEAYLGRGNARVRQGNLAGAQADLDEAIRLAPGNAGAYQNRGVVREGLGDFQGALADYDRALKLDPKSTVARDNRKALIAAHPELVAAAPKPTPTPTPRPTPTTKPTPTVKTPPPPGAPRIMTGTTSAESRYEPNCVGDVFTGGYWCNAKNGSDWVQRTFDDTYGVTQIRIAAAGTDVTTENSSIEIQLLTSAGWVYFDGLKNTNINKEHLSGGARGNSVPHYWLSFSSPVPARGVRVVMTGNGWFEARDIAVYGNRVSAAPTPTPTPKPGGVEVVAVLENRSSQNVHIFAQGDDFGPHNRLTPGEKRQVRLKLPADGRIRFTCGRNGQSLGTVVWNGDPDDPSRFPHVVFSQQEKLGVTTGLR